MPIIRRILASGDSLSITLPLSWIKSIEKEMEQPLKAVALEVNSTITVYPCFEKKNAQGNKPILNTAKRASSLNEIEQLSSTYDVVGKQIEFLKKAVVTDLNDLRNKTILNLSFVGTTVVLFVAALLWSNLIGLIAAAGLEGTNLYIQGKSWQDTITVYWKERTKIKIALNEIEGKYGGCKQNGEGELKEVQDLIAAFYTELKSASLS